MPPLSVAVLNTVTSRDSANAAENVLHVVCAWPVSSEYGPGSRILYYVLVAGSVLARNIEWLRAACLAVALLLPAVAAIHSIVLAALHVPGAVDMDVFGALQLCVVGVLAAPVTARISQTYFNDPGRNSIFLWTIMLLAGLLSLAVEFYRLDATPCPFQDNGEPMPSDPRLFPYQDSPSCGMTCNTTAGPFSPLRGGSANNIYVIPAPSPLTFGTGMLFAAGCCIPAILSLVSMFFAIAQSNWKRISGSEEDPDREIEGTNQATARKMDTVNKMIRSFLSVVEIPVFGGLVLAVLVFGEINFWTPQVLYEIEPMASIGQWASVVGTGIAALGSFYVVVANEMRDAKNEESEEKNSVRHCSCPHHNFDDDGNAIAAELPQHTAVDSDVDVSASLPTVPQSPSLPTVPRSPSLPTVPHSPKPPKHALTADAAGRRKVAKMLNRMSETLGTASGEMFDFGDKLSGKALDFPEIPGEELRNRDLQQIRVQYNQTRDESPPGLRRQPSRVGSMYSVASNAGEGASTAQRVSSPPRPPSPFPEHNSMPAYPTRAHGRTSTHDATTGTVQAQDTLAIPIERHGHSQNSVSSSVSVGPSEDGPFPPTIVVEEADPHPDVEANPR